MRKPVLGYVLAAAMLAWAAPDFEKVPNEARIHLKGTRGKPVRTGLVFVNGHYLKPPYTVARYGTAIYVNNVQVTGQIVPWRSFAGTPPSAAPAATPAAPARKESALDDLFDDSTSAPAATAERAASTSEFTPNARTNALLKRINDTRTDVHKRLLDGQAVFFGSRYPKVMVPTRLCRDMLGKLPEAMRDADDGADLLGRLKACGITYLSLETCEDLMANRSDYLALVDRRRTIQEDEHLQQLIQGGNRQGL